MKRFVLIPFLTCILLSCADQSRPEAEAHDARTPPADTTPVSRDTRSVDPAYSNRMESWADSYATALGTTEHPGFVDVWSAYGGDIDGDGDTDSVGLFSMSSGGNAVEQYAALFLQNDTGLAFDAVLRIGWRPEIINAIDSIGGGEIRGRTLVWREEDGGCCPSDSGRIMLGWKPGEILRRITGKN